MNDLHSKVVEAVITDFKNANKTQTHEQTDKTTGIANKWNCWNLFVILNAVIDKVFFSQILTMTTISWNNFAPIQMKIAIIYFYSLLNYVEGDNIYLQ